MTEKEKRFWIRFGNKVSRFRLWNGFTQDELASLLDVTRSAIANIETGRQVTSVYRAQRLSRILGVLL